MFDHNILITLLFAPVVAYIAGAVLFSIITFWQEGDSRTSSLAGSRINSGHSL
jgi:ATP/ADP translocase